MKVQAWLPPHNFTVIFWLALQAYLDRLNDRPRWIITTLDDPRTCHQLEDESLISHGFQLLESFKVEEPETLAA